MRSMTLHNPSSFPRILRRHLEEVCGSADVKRACTCHTKSPGSKLLDKFFENRLLSKGYSVKSNQLWVTRNCKFDLDLLITGNNWVAAVLAEGGKGARVDLDLMKFIAWGKSLKSSRLRYGVLIVSDKKLLRSITGATNESAFDYVRRLCPLFLGTGSNITDLFIVEFKSVR